MKKILNSIVLVCICIQCFGQKPGKVDLDSYSFNVKYQILPEKFIPFEKRTFSTEVVIGPNFANYYPNKEAINSRIEVYGWKKSKRYSNIDIEIDLNSFTMSQPKLENRIDESKDKDGKVVKTTYYFITAKIEVKGSTIIKTKSIINESGKDEDIVYNFNKDYVYKSNNENVSADVVKTLFEKQKQEFIDTSIKNYVELVIAETRSKVNNLYGLEPVTKSDKLWIIDSKEEEGAIQKEAIEAVKVIFSKMTATDPIDGIVTEISPLIEYFESLKTKYAGDDKSSKKIRYSAYYNLGRIYLHLDQPEKAIKEGEGLIANDYDKKDGKRIIEDANFDLEKFKNTAFKSKHNPLFY